MRALVGEEHLHAALRTATRNGTQEHAELLAAGAIDGGRYARALALALELPCFAYIGDIAVEEPGDNSVCMAHAHLDGAPITIVDATTDAPHVVARHIDRLRAAGVLCGLASREVIARAREESARSVNIDTAVNGLRRAHPESSATARPRPWQVLAPIVAVGLAAGGFLVLPETTVSAVSGLLALPFLAVTVLRLLALREMLRGKGGAPRQERRVLPPSALPRYSVLVPLFREQDIIPDLVAALDAIDYPRTRLEILLLIESIDLETQAALLSVPLPPHFRVVHVPDCMPRTKPKALNYALHFATGDLIVVYDAEDRPQPSQLRHAAEVFAHAPADVGCVQARLNIYNPGQSWLSRQFTIEYSALFDAVLPALERLRLPIPLGGTSNHFKRDTLLALSAWDPFNVTEDADLGIRLARKGYRTLMLRSTTWEEAPVTLPVWLRQRTRWIKGWMQTWLVHSRNPAALRSDLGPIGTIGLHAILGGLIASALAQPLFYALVIYQAVVDELFVPPETTLATAMMWICWANLTAGYAISMLVGAMSVWRRGRRRLALEALMMPLYWLLISAAAYRALFQLVREPYLWEKTPHGSSRRRRRAP